MVLASALAPAAVFLLFTADASPLAESADIKTVAEQAPMVVDEPAAPWGIEIVA